MTFRSSCDRSSQIRHFGLLGRGGHAQEVLSYVDAGRIVFYAVDRDFVSDATTEVPLDTTDPALLATPVHAAVGAPALRRHLVRRWAGSAYESVLHSSAVVASTSSMGTGSLIAPFSVLSAGASVGSHVILGCQSFVGHGSTIGDYATLSPGTLVGGGVAVGPGAFFGMGARVLPRLKIADGVVLGAGSVATTDLTTENGVYTGVPARLTRVLPDWLDQL